MYTVIVRRIPHLHYVLRMTFATCFITCSLVNNELVSEIIPAKLNFSISVDHVEMCIFPKFPDPLVLLPPHLF